MTSREPFDQLYLSDDPSDRAELMARCAADPMWQKWLEEEQALDAAARRIPLPPLAEDLFDHILQQYRARKRIHPLRPGGWARLAVAAAFVIGVATFAAVQLVRLTPSENPAGLLGRSDLRRIHAVERQMEARHRRLEEQVRLRADRGTIEFLEQQSDASRSEELSLLNEALLECRRVLDENQGHAHLHERYADLSRRKEALLRSLTEEANG